MYAFLADLVLVVHLAFIIYVVLGGTLALRWPRYTWVHLTAVAWAAIIELANWRCPLTPLENRLRRLAGEGGYESGFIEHYLVLVIYPAGLTRGTQIILGLLVVTVNLVIYAWVWRRRRGRGRE